MPDGLCFHFWSEIHMIITVIFTCSYHTLYVFKDTFMCGIHFSFDLRD
jgi:hypothetical protein